MSADDIYEGSHAEFVANESFVSQSERDWLRWCDHVELLLGHSLDGDQETDGYSLDFAHDAFEARLSPRGYALEVANEIQRRKAKALFEAARAARRAKGGQS